MPLLDVLSVCSELLDSEIRKIMETPVTTYKPTYRCSGVCEYVYSIVCVCVCIQYSVCLFVNPAVSISPGCGLRFSEVTSRSFPLLQRFCPHSCDLHMVLQQATHSYTKCLREICRRRDAHTTKQREGGMQSVPDNCRGKNSEVLNTHDLTRSDVMCVLL